ncbi:MAG: DUF1015 domain-containing protein [Candidatus Brocadiae bacterium]|nr:DUF1015 domain-containing protein [Candidatus Brocadiia bacterium]
MPELRPFRGIRYTPRAGEPGDVVAPPYDVIGPEQHLELCQGSPFSIAHLILGTRTSAEAAMPDDWYGHAAKLLQSWLADSVVATDDTPTFYVYTQAFGYEGRRHRRRLLLGALKLEPYEAGQVLPHEHTMPGPKADRLRLMQACRANLSPILAFSPDHSGRLNALLDDIDSWPPAVSFAHTDGVLHELRCVVDPASQDELARAIEPDPLYIADGHHRYETALAYQQLQRQSAVTPSSPSPADFTLAACMSGADPGMVIRPTHRLIHWQGEPDPRSALEAAREAFDVQLLPDAGLAEAAAAASYDANAVAFVIYAGRPAGYAAVSIRSAAAMAASPYPPSSALRSLPAAVLRHGFITHALGTADAEIAYTADPREAIARVDACDARLAALLPAVRPQELMAIVDAGERMPPKSTYFWPKPLTGMVMRSLSSF